MSLPCDIVFFHLGVFGRIWKSALKLVKSVVKEDFDFPYIFPKTTPFSFLGNIFGKIGIVPQIQKLLVCTMKNKKLLVSLLDKFYDKVEVKANEEEKFQGSV